MTLLFHHTTIRMSSPLQDGTIYLKFSNEAGAIKAQAVLNGRFFDGRQIQALFMPLPVFTAKFPDSGNATRPLKPSS